MVKCYMFSIFGFLSLFLTESSFSSMVEYTPPKSNPIPIIRRTHIPPQHREIFYPYDPKTMRDNLKKKERLKKDDQNNQELIFPFEE